MDKWIMTIWLYRAVCSFATAAKFWSLGRVYHVKLWSITAPCLYLLKVLV